MNAKTSVVGSLTPFEAWQITSSLTRPGSEFQAEVRDGTESDTPIAILFDESWKIVSWAATHDWQGQQTLEGFTLPEWRNRGASRAVSSLLVADGKIDTLSPIAVFSPVLVGIATSVGCRKVRLYELQNGVWVENS
jgi:hypothetical protein